MTRRSSFVCCDFILIQHTNTMWTELIILLLFALVAQAALTPVEEQLLFATCQQSPSCQLYYGNPTESDRDIFYFMVRDLDLTLYNELTFTPAQGESLLLTLLQANIVERQYLCGPDKAPVVENGKFNCICRNDRPCSDGVPDTTFLEVIGVTGIILMLLMIGCTTCYQRIMILLYQSATDGDSTLLRKRLLTLLNS